MKIIARTGPGHFTRVVMNYILFPSHESSYCTNEANAQQQRIKDDDSSSDGAEKEEDVTSSSVDDEQLLVVLPCGYFYPFPNSYKDLKLEDRMHFHRSETLAVHHWGCSWQHCNDDDEQSTVHTKPGVEGSNTKAAVQSLKRMLLMAQQTKTNDYGDSKSNRDGKMKCSKEKEGLEVALARIKFYLEN